MALRPMMAWRNSGNSYRNSAKQGSIQPIVSRHGLSAGTCAACWTTKNSKSQENHGISATRSQVSKHQHQRRKNAWPFSTSAILRPKCSCSCFGHSFAQAVPKKIRTMANTSRSNSALLQTKIPLRRDFSLTTLMLAKNLFLCLNNRYE